MGNTFGEKRDLRKRVTHRGLRFAQTQMEGKLLWQKICLRKTQGCRGLVSWELGSGSS